MHAPVLKLTPPYTPSRMAVAQLLDEIAPPASIYRSLSEKALNGFAGGAH